MNGASRVVIELSPEEVLKLRDSLRRADLSKNYTMEFSLRQPMAPAINPLHLLGDPASFDDGPESAERFDRAHTTGAAGASHHDLTGKADEPEPCGCEESVHLRGELAVLTDTRRETCDRCGCDKDDCAAVAYAGVVQEWVCAGCAEGAVQPRNEDGSHPC
jgi:hypothetical protein